MCRTQSKTIKYSVYRKNSKILINQIFCRKISRKWTDCFSSCENFWSNRTWRRLSVPASDWLVLYTASGYRQMLTSVSHLLVEPREDVLLCDDLKPVAVHFLSQVSVFALLQLDESRHLGLKGLLAQTRQTLTKADQELLDLCLNKLGATRTNKTRKRSDNKEEIRSTETHTEVNRGQLTWTWWPVFPRWRRIPAPLKCSCKLGTPGTWMGGDDAQDSLKGHSPSSCFILWCVFSAGTADTDPNVSFVLRKSKQGSSMCIWRQTQVNHSHHSSM